MSDPLQAFMQASGLATAAFPPGSRYHGLATTQWTRPDGELVTYVRRRFVPPVENFGTLREHRVSQGDRLDNLAATYLDEPQSYWRLCDGNGAIRPEELTETIGCPLRIPLPEGIPGGLDV
jgi:hypothetical protein